MENQEDKIEQEVQKTLASIDDYQRLEANPYFYEKLKERLSGRSNSDGLYDFVSNRFQPAFFVVLLLLNAYVGYSVLNTTNGTEDFMETLAEEYNLENTDLSNYDISE